MGINILHAIQEFYALEAIDALANTEPRHSHQRWLADFQSYQAEYTKRLANAIYDYTILAIGGEMRHAYNHSSHYHPEIPPTDERETTYQNIKRYTSTSIIAVALELFNNEWHECYGGENWVQIAQAATLRQKLDDKSFIDYCVDLSHNSGSYFDKAETGIFRLPNKCSYKEYLDRKRYYPPEELLRITPLSQYLKALVRRAVNLKILPPVIVPEVNKEVDFILQYNAIQWGPWELLTTEIEGHHCFSCNAIVTPNCGEYYCPYCGEEGIVGNEKDEDEYEDEDEDEYPIDNYPQVSQRAS